MDWFEKITGFKERSYSETKKYLVFEDNTLYCPINDKRYDLGTFEIPSLATLRERVKSIPETIEDKKRKGEIDFKLVHADAYHLHAHETAHGSVIQVASQFNLLEMPGMHVTPEDGVTGYRYDPTQGPACAMAAGPATIFRNYGIPIDGEYGQTKDRQINTLEDLVDELGLDGCAMVNGYAVCSRSFLERVSERINEANFDERERLKGLLRVGVHWHTTVTAQGAREGQRVTQVFCSALPIAYNSIQGDDLWEPFARLILEALYEATFCVATLNTRQTGNPHLYLTQVGGGVFGNPKNWIKDSVSANLERSENKPLKIRVVTKQ